MTPREQPASFHELVARRAETRPDDELVRLVGAPGWTAAALWERALDIAGALSRHVAPGDAVATCLPAGPEAIALTTALSALGAVELPLTPDVHETWTASLLQATNCTTIITADTGPTTVRRTAAGLPAAGHAAQRDRAADAAARVGSAVDAAARVGSAVGGAARVGSAVGGAARVGSAVGGAARVGSAVGGPVRGGAVLLDELIADGRRVSPRKSAPADPAAVMTTSGTTGRVKGALLPVGAGPGQAVRVQRAMQYDESDVLYSFFSWQHINARHAAFLPAVLSGARLVIGPRFSASRFLETVRAEGVTAFNFMGAVCALLLRQPPTDRDRDHLVRRAYGGPAPEYLFHAMRDRFGIELLQAYACTELGDVATTSSGHVRPGAAGRIVPEYNTRIVNNLDVDVAAGEIGELIVRPEQPDLTFTTYVGDPAAADRAWRGGWFHTGDQVRLEDGWLYFEGRSADVVRRRGINISPDAVEQAIASMPGVAEVAVVGVPSELTEDEVLAVVVPLPSAVLQPAEVRRHCVGRLPRHALPRFVSIEHSLPCNANLKVSRNELRARGVPPNTWDAESENP
ncbi:AMP-binding protein [Kribbella sp. CA-245084]|uniref:AMP-binding protein n=1 Tax=Kribbella sp. CA-245084 TaxID=3239940 RepID=UPI003D8A226E